VGRHHDAPDRRRRAGELGACEQHEVAHHRGADFDALATRTFVDLLAEDDAVVRQMKGRGQIEDGVDVGEIV